MPTTALFVMDFQSFIRDEIPDTASFDNAASAAAQLLVVARAQGKDKVLIVHVIAGGAKRTDHELYSVAEGSKIGQFLESLPANVENHEIVDTVGPLPGEQILARPRASPFHDTTLNAQLRSLGIRKLILTGVATSGVVLSIFRSAVDADYDVAVVREGCADVSPKVHEVLMEEFFAGPLSCGRVISVEEARKELSGRLSQLTPLFIMDFQSAVRSYVADPAVSDAAASRAAELLRVAREQGKDKVMIVHVIVAGGEDAKRNDEQLYCVNHAGKIGTMLEYLPVRAKEPGFVDVVQPLPNELVFSRARTSAFHDTSLNALLRAQGVTKLILSGVATSGVVLSTYHSGVDADYDVAVVGDACADREPQVHDVLVEKDFPGLGRVLTVEEAKGELSD